MCECFFHNLSRLCKRSGGGPIFHSGLRNLPVLAETAAEVASYGRDRVRMRTRQEMIERLFFYGINMASYNISIDMGVECPADILAYAAETEFFIGNLAVVAAKEAMENVAFIFLIEKGVFFHHASPCIVSHSSLSVQSSVIPGHLFEDPDDFPVFHVGKLAIEGCYGKG